MLIGLLLGGRQNSGYREDCCGVAGAELQCLINVNLSQNMRLMGGIDYNESLVGWPNGRWGGEYLAKLEEYTESGDGLVSNFMVLLKVGAGRIGTQVDIDGIICQMIYNIICEPWRF